MTITTEPMDINKLIKEYYELYATKADNLDDIEHSMKGII